MLAAEHGSQECLDLLLEANANMDRQNSKGWPATMFPAYHGKNEILEALIRKEADLNFRAKPALPPLDTPK